MTAGIYKILNTNNKKCYIGSSNNIKRRFIYHKYMLRHNKHCNNYLQNSWNKHKENNFKFIVLEKVKNKTRNELYEIEQTYLDKIKPEYNILTNAGSGVGYKWPEGKHPWIGRKHTKKWKEEMSEKLSGKNNPMYNACGKKNPMYGQKHTKKSITKNALSNSKLTKKQILEIKKLLQNDNIVHRRIAEKYGVSYSTVSEINTGKRFKYIKFKGE